jgi:hypothetical protein
MKSFVERFPSMSRYTFDVDVTKFYTRPTSASIFFFSQRNVAKAREKLMIHGNNSEKKEDDFFPFHQGLLLAMSEYK